MLLVWYTPPRAGAKPTPAERYAEYYKRKYKQIRDDEVTLLLLWFEMNNIENYKEYQDGKD